MALEASMFPLIVHLHFFLLLHFYLAPYFLLASTMTPVGARIHCTFSLSIHFLKLLHPFFLKSVQLNAIPHANSPFRHVSFNSCILFFWFYFSRSFIWHGTFLRIVRRIPSRISSTSDALKCNPLKIHPLIFNSQYNEMSLLLYYFFVHKLLATVIRSRHWTYIVNWAEDINTLIQNDNR